MGKNSPMFVLAITLDTAVVAGLDSAIHPSSQDSFTEAMDPWVKPGGDGPNSGRAP